MIYDHTYTLTGPSSPLTPIRPDAPTTPSITDININEIRLNTLTLHSTSTAWHTHSLETPPRSRSQPDPTDTMTPKSDTMSTLCVPHEPWGTKFYQTTQKNVLTILHQDIYRYPEEPHVINRIIAICQDNEQGNIFVM